MQILISPAKKQEYGQWLADFPQQEPIFIEEIKILQEFLRQKTEPEIASMMSISNSLAQLNYQRIQSFKNTWTRDVTGPAILSFTGDVYKSLAANDLSVDQLLWANQHVFIISGLYGLLRALDPIQYYRLEMKTKLFGYQVRDLYEFWGDKIKDRIIQTSGPVINLSSGEYFKAIKLASAITIDFKEHTPSGYKTIGVKAKRARGVMLRWLIVNQITMPEAIKDFNNGYSYNAQISTENNWVFTQNLL